VISHLQLTDQRELLLSGYFMYLKSLETHSTPSADPLKSREEKGKR